MLLITQMNFMMEKQSHCLRTLIYLTIKFLPLAVLFTYIAVNSITTSAHIVFQALSIVMSLLLILTTIAYAAYYTNDCYDETADH